jgi:hypothetical protein
MFILNQGRISLTKCIILECDKIRPFSMEDFKIQLKYVMLFTYYIIFNLLN